MIEEHPVVARCDVREERAAADSHALEHARIGADGESPFLAARHAHPVAADADAGRALLDGHALSVAVHLEGRGRPAR